MKITVQRLSIYAILISIALTISVAESWLPPAFIPIPGVKLGLSNIITLFALFFFGLPDALIILILRCILTSFFGGGITALIFSLCGGILAMLSMALCLRIRLFSICGVSIAGAAMHGVGQILAAILMLHTFSVVFYLPILLITAIFTGGFIGFISNILFARLKKVQSIKKYFSLHV